MANLLLAPLMRWLGRLSYPRLFMVAAALFVANLFVLDPLPFVDELLMGVVTLLLANWKSRKTPKAGAPIDGSSTRR